MYTTLCLEVQQMTWDLGQSSHPTMGPGCCLQAKSLIQNQTVILLSTTACSELNLTQSHLTELLTCNTNTPVTSACYCPLQGSSLKWDDNSTTQISKWKSCPKRKQRKWHTWCVLGLGSSISWAVECPAPNLVSVLSTWKWFHHLQRDAGHSSCLHSNSKCLLDGDKCLLAWESL